MKQQTEKPSTFSWIVSFAGEKKKNFIWSIFFAILDVLCSLVPYFFMADIVTRLVNGSRDEHAMLMDCLYMAVFWVLNVLLKTLSTNLSHRATFAILANIRTQMFDKLGRVPLGTVLNTPSGSLKNIMVERVNSVETTLAHVLPELTADLCGPLAILIYLFVLDWKMALVSLITLPLGLLFMALMMVGYEESYQNTVNKNKILNDTAVEYINGIEVIKVFGKAESSYEKFVQAAREASDSYIDWMKRCQWPFAFCMSLTPATLLTVLPIGGVFFAHGSLSADQFVMIIILSLGLIGPLISAMSHMDDIAKMNTIFGEVASILEMEEMARPETLEKEPEGTEIHLDQVRFSYNDTEVLHGVDLMIPAGKMTAFVGPSGSGKTTLARLIASLWDVDSGSITYGGVDIREIPMAEYQKRIAYVSQDNFLFNLSVRENIRMGRNDATDEEVEAIAKKSGCHDFILSLENGYDTVVGDAGGHLSGGERQRIAIARAMLKDAPVIILDEATAYTDPESEATIQRSVAKLVEGKTLIVIAHRLSTIVDADQIVLVDDGKVSMTGTQEELLAGSERYRALWESHLAGRDTAEEGGVSHA